MTTINARTGEVIQDDGSSGPPISVAETVAQMRARMTMTRAELVKAMSFAGILTTKGDRISFAQGNIPPPLRAMLDALPEAIQEDAEILLLTATDFPRVSEFWDAAIEAAQISNIQLDNVYREVEESRKQRIPE